MNRGLTTAMQTATSTRVVRPVFLVDLNFQSGDLKICSGNQSVIWNGTWQASGSLMNISKTPETTDLQAAGTSVILSGIPTSNLSLILGETYRNREATIYLACIASSDFSIVADPVILYEGKMDQMPIQEGAETSTIQINIENKLISLENAKNLKWTDQAQKSIDPTDKGCEYVAGLQNTPIIFGR